MTAFVQAWDPNENVYRKIEVATGLFVAEQRSPFIGVEEVDALERKQPQRPQRYDPLGSYR